MIPTVHKLSTSLHSPGVRPTHEQATQTDGSQPGVAISVCDIRSLLFMEEAGRRWLISFVPFGSYTGGTGVIVIDQTEG
jgi:hypothetical protein